MARSEGRGLSPLPFVTSPPLSLIYYYCYKSSSCEFSAATGAFERPGVKVKLLAPHPCSAARPRVPKDAFHSCLKDRPRPFRAGEGLRAQCAVLL